MGTLISAFKVGKTRTGILRGTSGYARRSVHSRRKRLVIALRRSRSRASVHIHWLITNVSCVQSALERAWRTVLKSPGHSIAKPKMGGHIVSTQYGKEDCARRR